MSIFNNFQNISNNFSYLYNWEEKYKYIIELGQNLIPLDEKYKNENFKIKGCTSQAWLKITIKNNNIMIIQGDSDAYIVKGLIAILIAYYSGNNKNDIKNNNIIKLIKHIGLDNQLTPQRAGGLSVMIKRIQHIAELN